MSFVVLVAPSIAWLLYSFVFALIALLVASCMAMRSPFHAFFAAEFLAGAEQGMRNGTHRFGIPE